MQFETMERESRSMSDDEDDLKPEEGKPGRRKATKPAATRTAQLSRLRQREHRERKAQHMRQQEATITAQQERITELETAIAKSGERKDGRGLAGVSASDGVGVGVSQVGDTRAGALTLPSCTACPTLLARIAHLENLLLGHNIEIPPHFLQLAPTPSFTDPMSVDSNLVQPAVLPANTSFDSTATPATPTGAGWFDSWYDITGSDPVRPKNAVELYGELDIEWTRSALKMLPSLKHSKYVDELLDLFLVQARCSDTTTVRKYMYRIVSVRYKLIDSCSVIDKQAYIEIMELFFKRNQKHREHWNTIMSAAGKSPKSQSGSSPASMSALSTPSGKPFGNENDPAKIFKDTVKTIPSLQGTDELIDEICEIFWSTSLQSEREEKMFRILEISDVLMQKCKTTEDRTKFIVAAEIARESNRKHMDELLDNALSKTGEL